MDGKPKQKRRLEGDTKEQGEEPKKKCSREASPPARPLQPRPPAQPPDDKVDSKKKITEDDIKLRVNY